MLNTEKSFNFTIENVTDSEENETRFIMLSEHSINYHINKRYKTSIVIMDAMNKSGVLSNILNEFSERGINLTSIISRPTKKKLGKYYFFIDIDGHYGILSNRNPMTKIKKCKRILKVSVSKSESIFKLSTAELLLKLTDIDINLCPCCKGKISIKRRVEPRICDLPARTGKIS